MTTQYALKLLSSFNTAEALFSRKCTRCRWADGLSPEPLGELKQSTDPYPRPRGEQRGEEVEGKLHVHRSFQKSAPMDEERSGFDS